MMVIAKYASWKGAFYPKGTKDEHEYYAQHFGAVELNTTFYAPPQPDTVASWRSLWTPRHGTLVVKAERFFTHRKKLNIDDCFRDGWEKRKARYLQLGTCLGAVLWQFPSLFQATRVNLQRIADLLPLLPPEVDHAFEMRHESWFDEDARQELLKKKKPRTEGGDPLAERGAVLRAFEHCPHANMVQMHSARRSFKQLSGGMHPSAEDYDVVSEGKRFRYVRFHGSRGYAFGLYGQKEMQDWATTIRKWAEAGQKVYVFFNNTDPPYEETLPSAVLDAFYLAAALRITEKPAA
ncbi:hypothetical protein JKP88DRAFT_279250 [Tribonema minus]|uniref:DUF72 domain-containing protein n=1 Tax=Tribonema minus TaxID=303371 RepID=A0A835YU69_9STRA|nr:hypothetical protein JKP88DRAFT_279250 [Tribonema minus]